MDRHRPRVSYIILQLEKCLKVLKKVPFGVVGHALKYSNEVGILKVRTEEANCNVVFRENDQLL